MESGITPSSNEPNSGNSQDKCLGLYAYSEALHTESGLGRPSDVEELQVDREERDEKHLESKDDGKVHTDRIKEKALYEYDENIEIEDVGFEADLERTNTQSLVESDTDACKCNKHSKYCITKDQETTNNDLKAGIDNGDNNSVPDENKSVNCNSLCGNANPGLDKGDSNVKSNDEPLNGGLEAAEDDYVGGLQFSSVVENIYFLDEEELMQEHEKNKQKNALLTNLDNDKHAVRTFDKNSNMDNSVFSECTSLFPDETLENLTARCDSNNASVAESLFLYIPDELVVKIFSYLNTEQLCRNASPVCRKWRQIAKEPTLWRAVDFRCRPELESLSLLWVLRKTPLLRKLVLRGRTNITHAEVAILSEMCPLLSDIDFGFCDNLGSDMIHTLVENCKQLRKLNVEGCDKIDHNCIKCLSKCKKLSCLNFSHCFLQDESLVHLAENLSQIVSINLDGISWITDRGVSSLVSKHCHHLVDLVLDGAEVSDAAIKNIARCQKLQTLELSFCEYLSDDSLVFLKDLTNLRELKLRKGSSFTKEGMSDFFKTVKLVHLKGLNLSECTCIDDSVVLNIAKWKLETLELLGIDKITGFSLSRVPEEVPNLTFLDLRQCNKIVDPLIVDMIRNKPDLKVFNYYGEEFVHQ